MKTPPLNDEFWMREALRLAGQGEGLTRPNPPVGAVIVKDGRLIASGWHKKAGGDHAEKAALKNAGSGQARGATTYVTLEPCCTFGRTPPCTDWLIEHGIRRVVMAVQDPNPRHAGRAVGILRAAGIEVTQDVCRREALELIAPFRHWITTGHPYATLKLALSADGRIADGEGNSKWITGPVARNYVQELRRRADAILVGTQTVLRDDPTLLPRPARGRKPWRVVLDPRGRLDLSARIFTDGRQDQTIVAVTNSRQGRAHARAIEKTGAALLPVKSDGSGRIDPADLFDKLGEMGILHVVCEGGGLLAEQLLKHGLVSKLAFFYAPCIIGGSNAVPSVGGAGWKMSERLVFEWDEARYLGRDILLTADLHQHQGVKGNV